MVTVFAITRDGTYETAQRLLHKARGLLVSDRAKVFGFWAMNKRQICWAHLLRKFAGFVERKGTGSQPQRIAKPLTQSSSGRRSVGAGLMVRILSPSQTHGRGELAFLRSE